MKVCAHCGVSIAHRRPQTKFCTDRCRDRAAYKGLVTPPERPCKGCGTLFRPRWPRHVFCDVACRRAADAAALEVVAQARRDHHADIEARYQAALAHIRATGQFRLRPEDATAQSPRRIEVAPDMADLDSVGVQQARARARQRQARLTRTAASAADRTAQDGR